MDGTISDFSLLNIGFTEIDTPQNNINFLSKPHV